jgi:low affinity Fe/Cu permease
MSRQTSRRFASVASWVSKWVGSHWAAVAVALLVVIGLAVYGINVTSIAISAATLLIVIVLQNSQNRDLAALHVKLDEVITHLEGPRDDVAGIEDKSHEEIEELHEELHGEREATPDGPTQDG